MLKNSPSKYANKDKYTNVKHHTKRRRRTGSIVNNNRKKSVFFKYVKSDKINKKVMFPNVIGKFSHENISEVKDSK